MTENEYYWIKITFFPRWDLPGRWSVTSERAEGYETDVNMCDWEKKKIHICSNVSGDDLRSLLIHEITNAVVKNSVLHKDLWQRRMLKAAARARQIGEQRLARMIEEDVDGYKSPTIVDGALIYGTIGDFLIDNPGATFDEVVSRICQEYPMRKAEFHKRYKKAQKIYEKERNQYCD